MHIRWLIFGVVPCLLALQLPDNPGLHYQIHRRGFRFSHHEPANLTQLTQAVAKIEEKYSWTYRDVDSNHLVRRWRPEVDEIQMLDQVGQDGTWYFELAVGQPSQVLEIDLDMLSPDFYTIMTSSRNGSKYDTFQSESHIPGDRYIHSSCRLAKDVFNLTRNNQFQLDWPICQASHSSRHTLQKSGSILGLAPHSSHQRSSLSRFEHYPFVESLQSSHLLHSDSWSVTLFDSTSGILTLGGTLATEMEEAKIRAELELKYFGVQNGQQQLEDEIAAHLSLLGPTISEQFKWLDVHASSGWWTGLINGIWINGVKALKNQLFLIDINCPFILSPTHTFHHFYNSIGGARILESPYDQFATFPCLNLPHVAFEMAGWQFPFARHGTRDDNLHGPTGGQFSLGKMNDLVPPFAENNESKVNSGFCIGSVVKTETGHRERWETAGMKGVWVLGEPFFRGTGVVFDPARRRIGFRSY